MLKEGERGRMGRWRTCLRWGRPLILALIAAAAGLAVFFELAEDVIEQEAFGFDRAILTWLAGVSSPVLTQAALIVTYSAAPLVLAPAMVLLAVLWLRRYPADWLALAVSLAGASLFNQLGKAVIGRARPDLFPALMTETGFSFPSGHSQAALAFYGVLAYLMARRVSARWRSPVYIAGGVWVLLVGLSRNYLGVHFPSDVLAAFAITLPWILAVIFVHQCYAPPIPAGDSPNEA